MIMKKGIATIVARANSTEIFVIFSTRARIPLIERFAPRARVLCRRETVNAQYDHLRKVASISELPHISLGRDADRISTGAKS